MKLFKIRERRIVEETILILVIQPRRWGTQGMDEHEYQEHINITP